MLPPPRSAIIPPYFTGDLPVCPVITEAESLYYDSVPVYALLAGDPAVLYGLDV